MNPQVLAAQLQPRRTVKICTLCGLSKPISEYHLGGSTVDGRAAACKDCAIDRTNRWTASRPVIDEPSHTKFCTGCWRDRGSEFFWRQRQGAGGLQTYCVDCHYRLTKGERVADIRRSLGLPTARIRRFGKRPA